MPTRPYTTELKSLEDIYENQIRIPMNQRQYSWLKNQIEDLCRDFDELFNEKKYHMLLGTIHVFDYNNEHHIFDGQQRLLSIFMMLLVQNMRIDELVKNEDDDSIFNDFKRLTCYDKKLPEHIRILNNLNYKIYPKIFCVNPEDRIAMFTIFNLVDEYINSTDSTRIQKINLAIKDNFLNKIKSKNDNNVIDTNADDKNPSNLWSTFLLFLQHFGVEIDICKKDSKKWYLEKDETYFNNYDIKKLKKLYKFILEQSRVIYLKCTELDFICSIFDYENNRGLKVDDFDTIKNLLLNEIEDNKKFEVYDEFEKLRYNYQNNIYEDDYAVKIMDIAIQIYLRKISKKENYRRIKCFKELINKDDENSKEKTYENFNKFKLITFKLHSIMESIKKDKYGSLINTKKQVNIAWEGYMYLLLPLCYFKGSIDKELIKLFTKWFYKSYHLKLNKLTVRNFNNMAYANNFIITINKYINDDNYDYYSDIKGVLIKNIDEQIVDKGSFIKGIKSVYINDKSKVFYYLKFLEVSYNDSKKLETNNNLFNNNNNIANVDRIVPSENKLSNFDDLDESKNKYVNKLGNYTILDNAENFKKKLFVEKLDEYSKSSSNITKLFIEDRDSFNTSNDINNRTEKLGKLLYKYTQY